jgi:hypothetical protein
MDDAGDSRDHRRPHSLERSDDAVAQGWNGVSMKRDWKQVFPPKN